MTRGGWSSLLGTYWRVGLAAIARVALAAPRPGIDHLGLHVETVTEPAILGGDALCARAPPGGGLSVTVTFPRRSS